MGQSRTVRFTSEETQWSYVLLPAATKASKAAFSSVLSHLKRVSLKVVQAGLGPRANALQKSERSVEYFAEQVLVAGDGFPGGLEGVLALVLAEQVETDAAQKSEIVGCVVFASAASVFSKDHIENPVPLIFDFPVRADGVRQNRFIRWQTAQVEPTAVAALARVLSGQDGSHALDTHHAL